MRKAFSVLFISILSIISGVIVSAQLLGFTNLYYPVVVYSLSVLLSCFFGFLLTKFSWKYIFDSLDRPQQIKAPAFAKRIVLVAGLLLFIIVLFLPLLFWPLSGINHELNWDAGLYHFPKAAELVVSHSSWDLTIPYGEYPYGFESLIAESLLLNHAGYLIGCVHALILLLFAMALFLVVNRYSRLPFEYSFFLVIAIIASYDIIRFTSANPFMIFRVLAFTIGKNDFFLSALMIAFIFFSPMGPDFPKFNLFGMGLTSALVCCTKPNGILLLVFMWIFTLILEIVRWRKIGQFPKGELKLWLGIILLNIIDLLWVLRNLIGQGQLFSESSLELQNNSILQNLTNPLFYKSLGMIPLLLGFLLVLTSVLCVFGKRIHYTIPMLFGVLILTFIITPATLYFGSSGQEEATIFWRLGFIMLVYEIPLLFILVDPIIVWLFSSKNPKINGAINILFMVVCAGISIVACYQNYSRIEPDKANSLVLRDQYTESVGVDGYFSAYDYVRQNVTHSVIWVDNGLPFYVYGDQLTNSTTHKKPADYQVFLQTNWNGTSGFPEKLNSSEWQKEWNLVYADPEGRVYKRINSE